jgi:hypothetical protein
MGDYFSNRQGEQLVKAGTCTNWRYVRRSECLKWLPFDGGNGADIKAAINNGKLLYRFPFPDEDAGGANNPKTSQIINFDAINKRDMYRTFSFRCEGIEVLHQDRCIPVSVVGESAPHINIFVKCPASGNLPYLTSLGGASPYIGIVGEHYDQDGVDNPDAKPYTIFRCCWCDQWFSVGAEEIEIIRKAIAGYRHPAEKWYMQVAEHCHPKP